MLIEIRCNKFTDPLVKFKNGLNVILGDENATNSIGKSTMLMVVDFVFGGKDFLKFNNDVVNELGHHDYLFSFSFKDEQHSFKRGTYRPELVYRCDNEYNELEPINVGDFTAFLKGQYQICSEDATFRSIVSLYSRVWGKENLNVNKPLHVVPNQRASDCIDYLIMLFDKYDAIKELSVQLKQRNDERTSLNNAFSNKIIPKIGKSEYNENLKQIEIIELEVQDIKNNLAKYALNINEIVNREVIELKTKKDEFLKTKLWLEGRLSRVRRNLKDNKHVKSRHLRSLSQFFPEVNMDRLLTIEEFHSQLSRVLKNEMEESEQELTLQLNSLNDEVGAIDLKISETLGSVDKPNVIVDRVYELSDSLRKAKSENSYYEKSIELNTLVKHLRDSLKDEKSKVLSLVEDAINDKIRAIINDVYGADRKSPVLTLKANKYIYEIFEETGTGKAYSNLIVLDLAILALTSLPFVIHDSLLFKNIENEAVAGLVSLYNSVDKQCFISIDEIEKYGNIASQTLNTNAVLKLNDDKVLYVKDWRTKH